MEIIWIIPTAAKTIMILYNWRGEWSIIMINHTILMLITATSSVTSSHSSSTCRPWHAGQAGARQEAAPPWHPSYRNHIKASLWHNFDKNKWLTWSDLIKKSTLTLFKPAYLGVSKYQGGGHIVPPLSTLGLGGVRVPILFGNDLTMNDWPYSKGFMKFGCLELSKNVWFMIFWCSRDV